MSMPDQNVGWIVPDWPAPARVRAGSTTRLGGVSVAPYDSLNLGDHVGDVPDAVAENRRRLRQQHQLPADPVWLKQVHGVVVVDAATVHGRPEADAAFSRQSGVVCTVMTADCLPVLLCDRHGTVVAAVHAGWRGLVHGVIEATVRRMGVSADKLMAWLGPAIGPAAFEVGEAVRAQFLDVDAQAATAFQPSPRGRWLADIYQLAAQRLTRLGVERVYGGHWCTFSDQERFYSYRRDAVTGRMASLIWLAHE
ncbi:laccase [Candidatus Tenderia electrophaga]|jgi:hypothetical protein|uniref:Purine nucleoside phosphorylase n=1 Tax=Candidatus Tenderia electrophaga TaxID=1748243 RepID=A0A0S2TCI2_9GAMM|nr:laccase [Candidatus Tenderia electrophaga]